MRRKLFNLATAVSLVLSLATLLLWIRSHFVADSLVYQQRSSDNLRLRAWTFASNRGVLYISLYHRQFSDPRSAARSQKSFGLERPDGFTYERAASTRGLIPGDETWFGFAGDWGTAAQDQYGSFSFPRISLPLWLILVVTGILPADWLRRWLRRRHRRAHGLCRHCGYDLRYSLERCPECGALSAGEPTTAA